MGFLDKVRQQKLLSICLLLFTLSIGIVIGTFVSTGVNAAKSQIAAPDATPLVVPPVSKLPNNQFVELAKKMEPSVVNISTEYSSRLNNRRRTGPPADEEDEDAMEMFRRYFRNGPPEGGAQPRGLRRSATGSGFIVDRNGYILTNNHVIDKADKIRVKMPNDSTDYKAKLIGVDLETDLAVIKIETGRELSPARIGNSDSVQVGDWAVAIGSPFGLEATVTAGIVSATGRYIDGAEQFQRFIQTDAAINPGNSGGPLLNINGEVIGINTAIATQSGGYQGIGFALPVNSAVNVYNAIIRTGKMSRGSIGIRFSPLNNAEVLRGLGLKEGVIVERAMAGGPSAKAGMKSEDVIVAFNSKPVKDGDDLVNRVSNSPIGSEATVTVDRAGKKIDLKVIIGNREEQLASDDPRFSKREPVEDPARVQATAKFGIGLRPANEAEREAAELKDKSGVVVTEVQDGSFAEEVGIQGKDIIVSINRQPVASIEDVRALQSKLKTGDSVTFRVLRPSGIPGKGVKGVAQQYTGTYLAGRLPSE
ncbi:MAG: Do family serine endopeptidase [Bryobacteraceae bacterium]